MKVALVYDRVNKWGGAERVLLALHELFPDASLYTSVYNKKTASWAEIFKIQTSFLQYFPFAKEKHEYYPLLMPLVFESFSFNGYDLVISVTSESAKGIITQGKTKHVCYILTPTRYLWSGYNEYFRNRLFRTISSPIVWYLRMWDKIASRRPDGYIAISYEVKKRVKRYYNQDAIVVYPPLTITEKEERKVSRTGFFLIVSRLVSYKKIDLAIKACNELQLPLIIIGEGAHKENLRKIAGLTVEFLGTLTDDELVGYYKNCRALIFPGEEDLGLTIIEAQSFGKPVIAYKSGGSLEIIKEGKTGEFFFPQTSRALEKVLVNFDENAYSALDCRKQSQKFTKKKFKKNFMSALKHIYPDIII